MSTEKSGIVCRSLCGLTHSPSTGNRLTWLHRRRGPSLGRRTVCGRTEQRRPPVSKRYETKVRMAWGSFLIAAATLKTPTRNGYNAQGVNQFLYKLVIKRSDTDLGNETSAPRGVERATVWPLHDIVITNIVWCIAYNRGVGRGVLYCVIIVR